MKKEQKISPLVMGALTLTLGMSLVNNANATLIAGNSDGAIVTEADIYVSNDSAFIDLSVGEGEAEYGFGIYVDAFSGSSLTYEYDEGYIYSEWGSVQFSTNSCSGEDFGEDNCLNKLDAGDEINSDWFDGSSGFASSWGTLYSDYVETNQNGGFESYIGNWGSVDDTGYVAFRFLSGYGLEGDLEGELFYGLDENIWNSNNVLYGWLEVTRGSVNINSFAIQSNTPTSVPEPGSLLLLGAGLFGLACRKKRQSAVS